MKSTLKTVSKTRLILGLIAIILSIILFIISLFTNFVFDTDNPDKVSDLKSDLSNLDKNLKKATFVEKK